MSCQSDDLFLSKWVDPVTVFPNCFGSILEAWIFFSMEVERYDHRPQDQKSLLDAMNAACRTSQLIIAGDVCGIQGDFFLRCMAMENIRCDVDENLWPDQQERQDVHQE